VSTARLTSVSHVVLGICARRGPTTSYELKRYVAQSIGYFWPIPHAQLYKEPQRLEELGLLRSTVEPEGRRRRFFEITEAGRSALGEWLADPTSPSLELRDPGLLKLHFGGSAGADQVRALAERQLEAHRDRRATFAALEERYGGDPERSHELTTLRFGHLLEQSFLAFWGQVADRADDLAAGRIDAVDVSLVGSVPDRDERRST